MNDFTATLNIPTQHSFEQADVLYVFRYHIGCSSGRLPVLAALVRCQLCAHMLHFSSNITISSLPQFSPLVNIVIPLNRQCNPLTYVCTINIDGCLPQQMVAASGSPRQELQLLSSCSARRCAAVTVVCTTSSHNSMHARHSRCVENTDTLL